MAANQLHSRIPKNGKLFIPDAFGCVKLSGVAVLPRRKTEEDPFYSLTLVARTGGRDGDTNGKLNDYSTGLAFSLPKHYHLEVVGTPALAQAGYLLPGVTVVTHQNMGKELVLSILKFDDASPDLELPFEGIIFFIRESAFAEFSAIATEKKSRTKKVAARAVADSDDDSGEETLMPAPSKGRGRGAHLY